MVAVRSNTGRHFRRDGVTFAPNQWKLLEEATPGQLAEAAEPLKALIILHDVNPDDLRFSGFGVDTTAIDPELSLEAPGDAAELLLSHDLLEAENEAFRDRITLLEAELAKRDKRDALEALNVPELVERAQEAGIAGAGEMKKAELIAALMQAE